MPQERRISRWERNFIEQMARLRQGRGLTQTDLAKLLKERGFAFHQPTVQRIETGERPVRLEEAFAIAELLDADVNTMVETSVPDAREMRYAVQRVRRRAARVDADLTEVAAGWFSDLEGLVWALLNRIEAGDTPESDEITAWGMAWLLRAWEIRDRVMDLGDQAGLLGAGAAYERAMDQEIADIEPYITVKRWRGEYTESLAHLIGLPAQELWDGFPGKDAD